MVGNPFCFGTQSFGEVPVLALYNFLVLNYAISSSKLGVLCTIKSIGYIISQSVKDQKCGQKVNY